MGLRLSLIVRLYTSHYKIVVHNTHPRVRHSLPGTRYIGTQTPLFAKCNNIAVGVSKSGKWNDHNSRIIYRSGPRLKVERRTGAPHRPGQSESQECGSQDTWVKA